MSIHPTLAWHMKEGVPSLSLAPQIKGLLPSSPTASANFLLFPSTLSEEPVLPSMSCHLSQAFLLPARGSQIPSGSRARISDSPSSRSRAAPCAPYPPRPQCRHTRLPLAQTLSHLLPRSAGTLRTRPAPGRPATLAAVPLAPVRVPAAHPPLTACFREPGRPPAAAMIVLSRDRGAALKPRLIPPSCPYPRTSERPTLGGRLLEVGALLFPVNRRPLPSCDTGSCGFRYLRAHS